MSYLFSTPIDCYEFSSMLVSNHKFQTKKPGHFIEESDVQGMTRI